MISIISASYGGYDASWPAPTHDEICTTLVTDSLDYGKEAMDAGWQNVVYRKITHAHPRLAAKVPKCDPLRFLLDCPTETVVWLDAAALIKDTQAFIDAVSTVPRHEPMAQFVHPDRDDVEDEAAASVGMEKYADQQVSVQARLYKSRGLPSCWGLWATGMIVYHPDAFDLEAFGNAWLAEQLAWTYQDQISEPYLLWKADYRPRPLPGHLRDNSYVDWMPHTRAD